jgi:hypothetical protein
MRARLTGIYGPRDVFDIFVVEDFSEDHFSLIHSTEEITG